MTTRKSITQGAIAVQILDASLASMLHLKRLRDVFEREGRRGRRVGQDMQDEFNGHLMEVVLYALALAELSAIDMTKIDQMRAHIHDILRFSETEMEQHIALIDKLREFYGDA